MISIKYTSNLILPDERKFEIVERKGIGHPDTLADGLAEAISIDYSMYCLKEFGVILHHNLDKISLIGGLTYTDFGSGKMVYPARLILNGRMSKKFSNRNIDIKEIQEKSAKKYIKKILPYMDIDNWLDIHFFTSDYSHNPFWFNPRGLEDIPETNNPRANDTSTCVSYWPLSSLEKAVLDIEGYFYDKNSNPKFDFIGQDIKIMAVRNDNEVGITIALPFISTQTPSKDFYLENIKKFEEELIELVKELMGPRFKVDIKINPEGRWKEDYYLLLTGSCIEAGEEGVVGRGNKSRGTISSMRPFSMEAPHGKNPLYHVGKMYTVISDYLSRTISEQFDCYCNIFMTSRYSDKLYEPYSILVETNKDVNKKEIKNLIEETLEDRKWTERILTQKPLLPKIGSENQRGVLL